ncbi:MAG: sterol desaturase family protein [Pseudomonadota bacterium]
MTDPRYALPFLLVAVLCAVAEYFWRKRTGRGYDMGALGGHVGIMVGFVLTRRVLTTLVLSSVLFVGYSFAPVHLPMDDWRTWVLGFFGVEFFYYWQHRFSHTIRWAWAGHSVHHSTNQFTLPAAFRLSWMGAFSLAWLALVPLSLMGFHPFVIGLLMTLNLNYQYFLHTEAIGKLGPLEWVFNTPSHHRAHHGSNEEYLDTNFGGVLIVFDRLFGTFAEERDDNPVVYGLTKKITSNNPFVINFHEWLNMARDASRARDLRGLARALFGRPSDISIGAAQPMEPARQSVPNQRPTAPRAQSVPKDRLA